MANKKKQFRKSVSFKPDVFVALDQHCKALGCSVAGYVELAVLGALAIDKAQMPTVEAARSYLQERFERKPEPPSFEDVISGVRML